MTIEVHSVQRLRVWSESSFATDGTATLANYTDVPMREGTGTMTLTLDSLDPMQSVQSRVEYREEVLGKRSATLQFTLNLAPTGTAAASGISAVQGALGLLLKATYGGETLGTGTTFTGGTATIPTVTSAAGFLAGGAIGWVNASGVLEVREIESIAANSITLKHAFSAAPTNAQVAYAAATYSFTEKKRIRKSFAKRASVLEVPFLLETQLVEDSHGVRLQIDTDAERTHFARRLVYLDGNSGAMHTQGSDEATDAAAYDDGLAAHGGWLAVSNLLQKIESRHGEFFARATQAARALRTHREKDHVEVTSQLVEG